MRLTEIAPTLELIFVENGWFPFFNFFSGQQKILAAGNRWVYRDIYFKSQTFKKKTDLKRRFLHATRDKNDVWACKF